MKTLRLPGRIFFSAPLAFPKTRVARAGFTVVEIVVCLALAATVVLFLSFGFNDFLKRAQGVKCASNLKQIHQGALAYMADNMNSVLPNYPPPPRMGWWVHGLEPYISDYAILNCPSADPKKLNTGWIKFTETTLSPPISYSKNVGVSYGDFDGLRSHSGTRGTRITEITDQIRTVFFTDGNEINTGPWNANADDGNCITAFRHQKLANVLFLDGHVECLPSPLRRDGMKWTEQ